VYFTDTGIITASDNFIRLWDRRDLTNHVREVEIPFLSSVEYVASYGNIILAAHKKGVVFLEPSSLRETHNVVTSEEIECASIAPKGQLFAVGSKLKVKEYRIDGQELESHRGHHGPVFHVRYSPTGDSFASGSEDGMIRIWPTSELIRKGQDKE
jgi:serine-threonine kinase receptor-associated protein